MRRRDERGTTVVILVVSIVTLMFIVSLVIDGGRAFTARRTAQNAADSAALAGAQALFAYQYDVFNNVSPPPSAGSIKAAVIAKLTENNATGDQTCDFVNAAGAPTGNSCGSGNTAGAAGVRASGTLTQRTAFAPDGSKLFTARGTATAAVQPLTGTTAPFIVCGVPSGGWPILDPVVPNQPVTINVANAVAAGIQPLQASKVPTCGAGSAFKGKALPRQEISIDPNDGTCRYPCGYADADNGNGYDAYIRASVAGAVPCPDGVAGGPYQLLDCDMLLPIADSGFGNGNSIKMHIVAFGIFHVEGDGSSNPKYYGRFVAPARMASGGTGGSGQMCNVGSAVCVTKLIG